MIHPWICCHSCCLDGIDLEYGSGLGAPSVVFYTEGVRPSLASAAVVLVHCGRLVEECSCGFDAERREVFDSDDLVAISELAAGNCGDVRLFLEIAKRAFAITFNTVEIAALRNVRQLAERILEASLRVCEEAAALAESMRHAQRLQALSKTQQSFVANIDVLDGK